MSDSTWLSDDELRRLTHRERYTAQARVLDSWGVPYRRRPDGTLLVGRAALDAALTGQSRPSQASNGIQWRRTA